VQKIQEYAVVDQLVYPRTFYAELDGLWLLAEWHEVSLRAFARSTAAQFLSGLNHHGEALGSPLLDPRFHTIGACRVHDQRDSWHAGTWRTEPPQRIEEADPLYGEVLE
jgi:hypothetical protein